MAMSNNYFLFHSPMFTIPGAIVLVCGIWLGQIYMKAQLSVKREMSNARSPVFSHFGAALAGITSIRAYGAQDRFKVEALGRIDRYTRAARTFYNLNVRPLIRSPYGPCLICITP